MDAAKRELIDKWKEKAEHDFVTASVVATQLPNYKDIVGFHCQQCAEKYIKSVLVFYDLPFSRTHDLEFLLDILQNATIVFPLEVRNVAIYLTDYAVEVRYPSGRIDVSAIDVQETIVQAEKIKKWAETIV